MISNSENAKRNYNTINSQKQKEQIPLKERIYYQLLSVWCVVIYATLASFSLNTIFKNVCAMYRYFRKEIEDRARNGDGERRGQGKKGRNSDRRFIQLLWIYNAYRSSR